MFAMGPAFFGRGSTAPLVLTGAFSAGTVGSAYSSSIAISGGTEPYSLTGGTGIVSGSLDSGFSLSVTGSIGARFLTLSCASPVTADTMAFTASIDSDDGQTATSAQSVTIAAAAALLLDTLTVSAVSAYSLRKLRNAYAGSCLKVRRLTDNAVLDIGFTSSGGLDTSALLAFIGASSGYVDTLYDQSGNGLHLAASGSAQPTIVTSGALNTLNGVPAMIFQGGQSLSRAAAAWASTTGWSANAVAKPDNYITAQQSVVDQDNLPTAGQRVAQYLRFANASVESIAFNTSVSAFTASTAASSPIVLTAVCSATGITAFANGTPGTTTAVSGTLNTGAYQVRLGRSSASGGSQQFSGKCCEAIIFSTPIGTTDRHAVERDQGTYYGVVVA